MQMPTHRNIIEAEAWYLCLKLSHLASWILVSHRYLHLAVKVLQT